MKKLMILAATAAMISAPAMAAPGDTSTATGAATAEVVAPITLTHTTGAALDFGSFTTGTGGGTVAVTQGGVGTASGDVTLVPTSVEAADAFTVTGEGSRTFAITSGGGSVSDGTTTMAFTTSAPTTGTLSAGGTAGFSVGGTLTVAGGEDAGVYTGTYSVTASYN